MAKLNGATMLAVLSVCLASARTPAKNPAVPVPLRPTDVTGWGKTRWGMSESEVKRTVRGRWRVATKEEREDDDRVYMPFILQDVTVAGRKFIGLFGFSLADHRLVRVTLHSGVPLMRATEAAAVFEHLANELERELGPPARTVRNKAGHTIYTDYAVWRFPSSVIELTCMKPNDTQGAVALSYAPSSEPDGGLQGR